MQEHLHTGLSVVVVSGIAAIIALNLLRVYVIWAADKGGLIESSAVVLAPFITFAAPTGVAA